MFESGLFRSKKLFLTVIIFGDDVYMIRLRQAHSVHVFLIDVEMFYITRPLHVVSASVG